jgi:hypothetical protein
MKKRSAQKDGRANWPEVGETRVLIPGTPESDTALRNLSKQVYTVNRINELVGPLPNDGCVNNHLFAIARKKLGMTREEFDATDDWDLRALLELEQRLAQSPKFGPGDGAKNIPETKEQRAERRKSIIYPLLLGRGMTVYRWEKKAGVSSKVGQRYYDGTTR